MAKLANKTCDFGVIVTYWSADEINIYWDSSTSKRAHVVLNGYRSESAKKTDNEKPVTNFTYDFGNDLPFTKGGNSEQQFYTWLDEQANKELAEGEVLEEKYLLFKDSGDC